MPALSISRAWDESKAIAAQDGRLIGAVALALVAFPAAISGLVSPAGVTDPEAPVWARVVAAIMTLITVAGQLAIIRLAIGPSSTVGDAIGHGMRRMPIYLLAAIVMTCAALIVAIPFVAVAIAAGVPLDAEGLKHSGVAALLGLIFLVIVMFFAIRMLLASPVASAERVGPIGIIRRSWQLTAGHWWRLFGFIMVFFIGALVLFAATGAGVGVVAGLFFGKPEPLSASALIVALVLAVVDSAVTALLAVMLARIYVQLAGQGSASVPSSGT
jgi:Membrane domain of glycerophosphoryl diester phosphodiesterase